MKLVFSKNEDDNITIQIVKGTTTIDFTYVDMVKELLENNSIEDPVFNEDAVSDDEKGRIKSMLQRISSVISKGSENNEDDTEVESDDLPF